MYGDSKNCLRRMFGRLDRNLAGSKRHAVTWIAEQIVAIALLRLTGMCRIARDPTSIVLVGKQ